MSPSLAIFPGTGRPVVAAGYDATILAESSLVGFWPLNDASGTTAVDAKNGNNGTYSGSFSLAQTSILPTDTETCANFTGGKMVVTDTAVLRLGAGDYSIECWLKPSTLPSYASLIDEASRSYMVLVNAASNGNQLFLGIGGTNINGPSGLSGSIAVGSTTHFVFVHGPGNAGAVYFNGTRVDSLSSVFGGSTNSSTGFSLCANPSGGGGLFQGTIQKLALYNAALSAGRVSAHYAAA